MPVNVQLLESLRRNDAGTRAGIAHSGALADEWHNGDVRFAASSPEFEAQYYRAVKELFACIKPTADAEPILNEGGIYYGCWLESTGTINAELLSRFLPSVATQTFGSFARYQRDDGLFPYKLTADGPVFSQIQLVTPLARSVWTHHQINGLDTDDLRTLFAAMARYDDWLARHRDTRGTGAVEAFCTFDTGHDLSARFWHVPDSPFGNDPERYNPDNPILPFIAPDLTANVACQRLYLAKIAEALGEDGAEWRAKSQASLDALFAQCFDEADGFFYDRDRNGHLVKVQSDVLLRVLACEVGDDAFFEAALSRYLLNTRKFFAKFPFTSIALDDPRFDPAFDYNSWSGPTNFLSLIRAPHAFEAHNRHVELTWVLYPILSALFRMERFAQTLNPFTGKAGFTEVYSPAILCLLDFVERLSGVQPRPDGTLWFTGLIPYQIDHRDAAHETAYGRTVDGRRFELVNGPDSMTAFRDGDKLFDAPKGVRVVTDRTGTIVSLIGMSVHDISGSIELPDGALPFEVRGNQQLDLVDNRWVSVRDPGLVFPRS
ncbi:MGH1-like glycoside hydrolase domain-containing protein [Pelagibacterium xiamenense]|uniref:MGH1-like glycoside hydrolase domain-containing protein n=1 Tax=Pelagibacterium xiamenense TaxID=2901140 RepID=UPI001E495772|nr:hypothetical protein [Pelagibacterium xiamenense]MCD7059753.1 hypothetical protein [Pelagibacterium xiamenense]